MPIALARALSTSTTWRSFRASPRPAGRKRLDWCAVFLGVHDQGPTHRRPGGYPSAYGFPSSWGFRPTAFRDQRRGVRPYAGDRVGRGNAQAGQYLTGLYANRHFVDISRKSLACFVGFDLQKLELLLAFSYDKC